ncbi:MAG: NYN domain-containing protein [Acidobacteria bacterium]|nr:NYN domain-containing protein [Acidobacteriota bacterium]
MNEYLFVDGAYLRQRFKEWIQRSYGEAPASLCMEHMRRALGSILGHREIAKCFYYDCVDDGDAVTQKFFDHIRALPGWHVREGRLVGGRKERRSQKRVDVMLTVEMLSHAINKNMDRAILLAGDDDFTPLVDELLRHGTYVEVWSARGADAKHLNNSADESRRMTFEFFWHLTPDEFQSEHPYPDFATYRLLPGHRALKSTTSSSGQEIWIKESPYGYHFVVDTDSEMSLVTSTELMALEEFIRDQFAERGLVPIDKWPELPSPAETQAPHEPS